MAYDKVNYANVEPVSDGLHFLRDPLDCSNLGVSVLECDAEWTGMEHDHADDEQEEVYLLAEGAATVAVDGEDVDLAPGDAVRIPPEATRQIRSEEDSTIVLVGAP